MITFLIKWRYTFWHKNWTKVLWGWILEISRGWNSLGFCIAYFKEETAMDLQVSEVLRNVTEQN